MFNLSENVFKWFMPPANCEGCRTKFRQEKLRLWHMVHPDLDGIGEFFLCPDCYVEADFTVERLRNKGREETREIRNRIQRGEESVDRAWENNR